MNPQIAHKISNIINREIENNPTGVALFASLTDDNLLTVNLAGDEGALLFIFHALVQDEELRRLIQYALDNKCICGECGYEEPLSEKDERNIADLLKPLTDNNEEPS
jgi:hypothetical protein